MNTLNSLIAELSKHKKTAKVAVGSGSRDKTVDVEQDIPVMVNIYGVTQKRVVRSEMVIEAGYPKLLLFLEDHDEATREELIRSI